MKRGLGNNDDCKFFCRLKNKIKSRLKAIGAALITGQLQVAIGMIVTSFVETAIGMKKAVGTTIPNLEYEPTTSEQNFLEQWNDNNFGPFCELIEALIISNDNNKNTALKLMQFYEAALYNQTKNGTVINGLSAKGVLYRYAFVKNIFDEIRATLVVKPTIKQKIASSEVISMMSSVKNDLTDLPNTVEVMLLSDKVKGIDLDLNLPTKGGIKNSTQVINDIALYDPDKGNNTTQTDTATTYSKGGISLKKVLVGLGITALIFKILK